MMARGGASRNRSNPKRANRLSKTFKTVGGAERYLERSPLKGFAEVVRKGNLFGFKWKGE